VARILLGVSGGIAAYKALELVRLATAAGHAVRVIQTPASRRFVGEASFAALTGAPVLVSEFERDPARGAFPGQAPPAHEPLSHLELVANAELLLIAPASANTLAKLATGLADNLLASCALAATCPVLVAPAMNNRMYEHPATRANIQTLRDRGVSVVEPGVGRLASRGEQGVGRLAEPERILTACEDSVRFLGNSSSGRMGLALAAASRARGADVTLVAANVAAPPPPGVSCHRVTSAAELRDVCEREFPACDILLMTAAVADFRPAKPAEGKIRKAGRARLDLELEPTADVIAGLAARRRDGQTLVGFAAEHGESALEHGRAKLSEKRLDAVVVNDISRADIGFEVDANEVTILTASGSRHVPRASKARVAEAILDAVEGLRRSG
jgi:phosphopantothenoylcysteine decarboxylase/phosphopantothenate--cysteine ligase